MRSLSRLARVASAVLGGSVLALFAQAQTPDCGTIAGTVVQDMLHGSDGFSDGADVIVAGNYVYALMQWGVTRVSITSPGQPSDPHFQLIGHLGGPPNSPLKFICDCFQGPGTFAVAADPGGGDPGGDSRIITDWEAHSNTGGFQVIKGISGGTLSYGQQVNSSYALGAQNTALFIGGKYYAFLRDPSATIMLVDMTTVTGDSASSCTSGGLVCSSDLSRALQPAPTSLSGWTNAMVARQDPISGKYLLLGTKPNLIAVAEINPATGQPVEKATVSSAGDVASLDVANVNGRTFIFSAENLGGLRFYELTQIAGVYSITPVSQPAAFQGTVVRVKVNDVLVNGVPGSAPPVILLQRPSPSVIEIWDSGWLTQGGQPRLGKRIPHVGNLLGRYLVESNGFAAKVIQSGPTAVTAYVYEVAQDITSPINDPLFAVVASAVDIHCIASDPTAPTQASLAMRNKRTGATNCAAPNVCYQGDRWVMSDTTLTGVPLINVAWDLNVPSPFGTAQFTPDAPGTGTPPLNWSMSADGTVPQSFENLDNASGLGSGPGIFWPCDPAVGGHPDTGSGCYVSVGDQPQGYAIGIRTKNTNPPGNPTPSTYVSAPVAVLKPQARVANMVGGVVHILTGAQIDASLSDGNLAVGDTRFDWVFTGPCPSGCPGGITGVRPNAPAGADHFTLTVTYGDGYVATLGPVQLSQDDIEPSFALQSSTVLINAPLTLINTMDISQQATVTSVDYVINTSPTPTSGTLAASFNVKNGQALVTAPGSVGTYTITLTYHYWLNGVLPILTAAVQPSLTFNTNTWSPAPAVNVYTDSAGTNPVSFFPPPTLTVNGTYYIKDYELVPNGVTYPGATYYLSTNSSPSISGDTLIGSRTDQLPVNWTFSTLGTFYLKAVVQTVVSAGFQIVVANPQPLSVQISGPTSGSVNQQLIFTALVSPSSAVITTYRWDCDFSIVPNYSIGSVSQPCTYASNGAHAVILQVTDSTGATASASLTVSIGGGGGGNLSATVTASPASPAARTPVTFTASASGGVGGYTYGWKPGESPFFETSFTSTGTNPNYPYTYAAAGTYTATCQVMSGSSTVQATKTIVVTPAGPPAPLATYAIPGITPVGGTYTVEAGRLVTFQALEVPQNVAAVNGYAWAFPDGSTKYGQQVAFTFFGTGAKQVTLTVTGDGVNRAGATPAVISFNVVVPSFQAMLVSSAEHSAVLTDPNGILKFWATDVSVANPGSAPVTISPAFLSFTATQGLTFDLSTITFDPALKVTIPGGGQHSWVDIVKILAGDVANKGTLVLKYESGNATPLVTARVYFAPAADPLGPASGSALPAFRATSDGQVVTQGTQVSTEQALPGLRGDLSYYFRLTLFNSSSTGGTFRVSAVDDRGVPVSILDPSTGAPSSGIDFAIGPYHAIDWSNDSLGLNDPTTRYVLKAHRTSSAGHLVASAAVRDRLTRDQVLVSSDVPPEFRENCVGTPGLCVNYVVPGASRFQSGTGARWRTGLAIFNPSLSRRGVGLEYRYQDTALAAPESVAKGFIFMDPGQLAFYDDVVAQVFANTPNNLADPSNGTAGVLRIVHFVDADTSTAPLIVSARNYDDQPTGTVGSQLSVYTQPISIGLNEPSLRLAGAQADATDGSNPKPRFETILSVFSFDDTQTTVRLTAVKNDGTVLGFHDLVLNQPGAGGHFQPRNLNISDFHAVVNEPVTIKVDVMSGGRVGAYALIRDLVTRDPTYVQAVPQN